VGLRDRWRKRGSRPERDVLLDRVPREQVGVLEHDAEPTLLRRDEDAARVQRQRSEIGSGRAWVDLLNDVTSADLTIGALALFIGFSGLPVRQERCCVVAG